MKGTLITIALNLLPGIACAATMQLVDPVGGVIPDASLTGISRSLVLTAPGHSITSVEVEISLAPVAGSAAFLGDLYFFLTDGTTLVTLANRPGRDTMRPDGYDDDQSFSVVFADSADADFHLYRESVTGSEDLPLTSPLGGAFQPDGRTTDPTAVVSGDSRDSQLADFSGLSAERTFTLFAADLSLGAVHEIDRWSLSVETIPEPSPAALLALLLGGLGFVRSRQRR
ncbi:MAG: PEP-CTERM sorting domain-containing protein [Verrucomicrobiales bacterium]